MESEVSFVKNRVKIKFREKIKLDIRIPWCIRCIPVVSICNCIQRLMKFRLLLNINFNCKINIVNHEINVFDAVEPQYLHANLVRCIVLISERDGHLATSEVGDASNGVVVTTGSVVEIYCVSRASSYWIGYLDL